MGKNNVAMLQSVRSFVERYWLILGMVALGPYALSAFHWEAHDKAELDSHPVDYSDPAQAYWGRPTAAIDWCEQNYSWTPYIAEFWNTISSGLLVLAGFAGVYECHLYKLETRFVMSYWTLSLVGVGSILFHGTLLYELQMADELPMIWASLVWMYVLINNECERGVRLVDWRALALYGLVATYLFIYITDDLPAVFQVHILVQAVWAARNVTQMLWNMPDDAGHTSARYLFRLYGAFGMAGFACWIIENGACSKLSNLPGGIPNPQLHAFWHVLMALNCYCGPMFVAYNRGLVLRKNPKVTLSMAGLPTVQYLNDVKVE